MKFDLVANRKFLYLISGGLFALSLVLLAIPPALRPGIEFTAGTTTQIRFKKAVSEQDLRNAYGALGHDEARIATRPAQARSLGRGALQDWPRIHIATGLGVTQGTLTVAQASGVTLAGSGTAAVSLTGSVAAINSA